LAIALAGRRGRDMQLTRKEVFGLYSRLIVASRED